MKRKTYKLVIMLETDESATDPERLEDLFERMILEAEMCREKACESFGEPLMSVENGEEWSLVFGEVKVDDSQDGSRNDHDDNTVADGGGNRDTSGREESSTDIPKSENMDANSPQVANPTGNENVDNRRKRPRRKKGNPQTR